jgi:hypothetical protein
MSESQLREVIEGIRARLQAELESQFGALTTRHDEALEITRKETDAAAEARWTARHAAAELEWQGRLTSEVAGARADVERQAADAAAAARAEWERESAEAIARLRQEFDDKLTSERHCLANDADSRLRQAAEEAAAIQTALDVERQQSEALRTTLAGERRRMQDLEAQAAAVIDAERQRLAAELAQARTAAAEAVRALEAERQRASDLQAALDAERQRADEARSALADEQQRAMRGLTEDHASLQTDRQRLEQQLADAHAALQDARQHADRDSEDLRVAVETARGNAEAALADARVAADSERQRASRAMDEARAAFDAERQRWDRETADLRRAFEMERQRASRAAAQPAAPSAGSTGLLAALRALDSATSLTDALGTALKSASAVAPRAALFLVEGQRLAEWTIEGLPRLSPGSLPLEGVEPGVLAAAVRRGRTVLTGPGHHGATAPACASLADDRTSVAVPFVLGGQAVGVLYADDGSAQTRTGWQEPVQILGHHASACLASLTACRTAQAVRMTGLGRSAGALAADDENGARRYARLLVSEIKLYNEASVRIGREKRDLMARLRPEIERARRLYDERRGGAAAGRDVYFHQELVQTLAGGDPDLLG